MNKPFEINPEQTKVLELTDKGIETVIITVFQMFIKLSRNMRDIF